MTGRSPGAGDPGPSPRADAAGLRPRAGGTGRNLGADDAGPRPSAVDTGRNPGADDAGPRPPARAAGRSVEAGVGPADQAGHPENLGERGPPLRLVVIGDSSAFTDASGPQLPGHPGLYPTIVARRLTTDLGREVTAQVVARPGQTVRAAARDITKDRHLQFEVLAGADAVIVGVGSFDHAPIGVPPSIEAVVPYLRPAALRRQTRAALRAAYPRLVRLTGGHRTRTPRKEFDRLFAQLLDHVRWLTQGHAAGVVIGPTSHRSAYYGHRHPGRAASEARQLALARSHGFAVVPSWEHVRCHLDVLNADGIHWPSPVHERIGNAVADALIAQLRGERPRIGMPSGPAPA